ncbi:MAG: DUF3488 domain-containing protein [Geobacter sp.]|nr:DUF3488 domain-containing protein [Geobacter sp.]
MIRIKAPLDICSHAVSLLALALVFPYIDLFARVTVVACALFGIYCDKKGRYPVPTVAATIFSVGIFVMYALKFTMANPVLPAVHILALLLAVRLASAKEPRNYLQMYALSLFLLAGYSLLSLSAAFLGYLAAMVILIAVSLVLLTFHATDREMWVSRGEARTLLLVSTVIPILSLFLMVLFFFVLPRTQYPIWNVLNKAGQSTTGMSETVAPGRSGSVAEVKKPAFRVSCRRIPQENLYWRGIVLNYFDGATWSRGEVPDEKSPPLGGSFVDQTIYPEPNRGRYLPALNIPASIRGVRGTMSPDRVFSTAEAPTRRLKYEARSVLVENMPVEGEGLSDIYLQLPENIPSRISELARQLFKGATTTEERVARLRSFYQNQRFAYSTTRLPTGSDALEKFLFETKSGHCEFFASTFALLLRVGGVPARLVGGYYGGEYNEIGAYYLITEDMAHVWVEVFIPGKGWVTIDPSGYARNFREVGDARTAARKGLARLLSVLDTLNYYWNQAVITYDLEKQITLFTRAGAGLRQATLPRNLAWIALILLAVCCLAICGYFSFRYARMSPEARIIKSLRRKLKKKYGDLPLPEAKGLFELADELNDPDLRKFAELYYATFFRDRKSSPEEIASLRRLLNDLK